MTYKLSNLRVAQLPLFAMICAMLSGCGGGSGSGAASSTSAPQTGSGAAVTVISPLGTGGGANTINVTGSAGTTTIVTGPSASIATNVLYTTDSSSVIDEVSTAEVADNAGNIYVADVNQQLVWKITPSGNGTVYIGNTPGATVQYNLGAPQGLAIDPAGNLYIGTATGIVQITPSGSVSVPYQNAAVYAATPDGYTDQRGVIYPAQQFAVDGTGNLYVTVTCSGIVRKVTPSGVMSTIASGLGIQTSATNIPDEGVVINQCNGGANGIAVDVAGNVYAADSYNHVILKIAVDGTVATLAGTVGVNGAADGTGSAAGFNNPQFLSLDGSGNLYVADSGLIRKITPQGKLTTLVGGTGSVAAVTLPNAAAPSEFGPQAGIVVGASLYVLTSYSTDGWALLRFDNLP